MSSVKRRQGGAFSRGDRLPQQQTKIAAVIPNAVNKVSGLNIVKTLRHIASEQIATVAPVTLGSGTAGGPFQILINWSVNPADPGIFPSLAATANQYQRFKTLGLRCTYTPLASTATDGMIYMAFQPDPSAIPPSNAADFMGLIGAVSSTVYGQPLVLNITPNLFQQAYNSQVIQKPQDASDDTPLNTSGSLFVAVSGVSEMKNLGNLVMSYGYDLMNKQVTQGSNTITGSFDLVQVAGEIKKLTIARYNGYKIVEQVEQSIYRTRMPTAAHTVSAHLTSVTGSALTFEIADDNTEETTWTTIAPISQVTNGTTEWMAVYDCPPSKFWRVRHGDAANTAVEVLFRATTLPSRIPDNEIEY